MIVEVIETGGTNGMEMNVERISREPPRYRF
jgi:hypothetical protein